ncbi:hypothetical protein GJ654_13195 [Rhodoblastus acidophilus]|uniref:Uncharacterized protein n=1 Tax=Rhodoblastus acidophilus TaxID=1074 RepID=A0A6N8DMX4_RHOAC|nr:hypothetical protein [Rhodoblastus acidophilus]
MKRAPSSVSALRADPPSPARGEGRRPRAIEENQFQVVNRCEKTTYFARFSAGFVQNGANFLSVFIDTTFGLRCGGGAVFRIKLFLIRGLQNIVSRGTYHEHIFTRIVLRSAPCPACAG